MKMQNLFFFHLKVTCSKVGSKSLVKPNLFIQNRGAISLSHISQSVLPGPIRYFYGSYSYRVRPVMIISCSWKLCFIKVFLIICILINKRSDFMVLVGSWFCWKGQLLIMFLSFPILFLFIIFDLMHS